MLKQSIASYRQIKDHTLVIHDTGSTYIPLLDYLAELEQQGTMIYWGRRPIALPDDLNSVDETVLHWLDLHPKVNYYVVSDPDVALDDGCADIFEFYRSILDNYGIRVIGPMLRIDDIPEHFPLRNRAIKRQRERFWSKTPLSVTWQGRKIDYQLAHIDATFGMYPRQVRLQHNQPGWRTHKPYWARHLDWYIDPKDMAEDQKLYLQTASDVSHYSGSWLREALK